MAAFDLGDFLVSRASQALKSVTKSFRNLNIGGITSALGFRLQHEEAGRAGSWQEKALNRPDPLLSFDWEVMVTGPAGLILPPEYIEEVDCPNTQIDVDRIFRGGSYIKIAKFYDIPSLNMVCYEDNRATTIGFFRSWFESIYSPEGYVSPPDAYKGMIVARPMDVQQNVAIELIYSGVFPVNFPNVKLGNTSERITHNIEFAVDALDVVIGGSSANLSGVEVPLFNKIGKAVEQVNRVVQIGQNVARQLTRF